MRQHDTLQGSSVVVSSGADFLCCKGQLNRLSQLHVASCGSNTACRSSRGRGGSCRRSSSLSTGSHAGAACHSSSCTNHTCDLQEISASDLFHNPFLLFSWGFVVRTRLCLSTFFCGVAAFHSLCSFMLSKLYSIRSAVAREKFRQTISFCNTNQFFAQKRPRNRSILEQIQELNQNYCFKIEPFIDFVPCVSFLSSMQKAPG